MMRLPDIVGVELNGKRQAGITATDIVLALTEILRKERVVRAFVEFFGEGARSLSIGNRATITNMTPGSARLPRCSLLMSKPLII